MNTNDLGTVPFEEPCLQLGTHDFEDLKIECTIFLKQLKRVHPKKQFRLQKNPHEFGTYYSAIQIFEDWDDSIDNGSDIPANWDKISIDELKQKIPNYFNMVIQ